MSGHVTEEGGARTMPSVGWFRAGAESGRDWEQLTDLASIAYIWSRLALLLLSIAVSL